MATDTETQGATEIPAGSWTVDPVHSVAGFAVRHMMVGTFRGEFSEIDATLTDGKLVGKVKVASLQIKDENLKGHLFSPDFFDVERYPEISFNSTRIDYLDGGRFRIVGALTMRGVIREIKLDAQLGGTRREAGGDERIELALRGELNRRDFGLTWNQVLETGGALLGNKVKIALDISAMKSEVA